MLKIFKKLHLWKKRTQIKWKSSPCLWIGKLKLLMWQNYQKPSIDSMQHLPRFQRLLKK